MTFETCSSCGIPFTDHAGIIGTCRELQEAKGRIKELEAVLRDLLDNHKHNKGQGLGIGPVSRAKKALNLITFPLANPRPTHHKPTSPRSYHAPIYSHHFLW